MSGTIVYDATGETAANSDTSAENGNRTAFSFTAGSSFPGTLSDVKIDLGDLTPGDGGTVTAYLYSDAGGSGPGTQLATLGTLSDSSLTSAASLADFPISSTINLSAGTRYWVVLADSSNSGAFVEYGTNDSGTGVASEFAWDGGAPFSNSGGADIAQVTETLNNADQVPVVATTSGATAFVVGAGPVAVDSGINVTDADNTTLASATVSISGNFQFGEDQLAFINTSAATFGNISGNYNNSTGVLTLSSADDSATVGQFKAALEAVTYADTAATPATLTRTLSFTADDAIGNSLSATKQIVVVDSASSRLVYDNSTQAATGTDTSFEDGAYSPAFSFTSFGAAAGTLTDVKIDLGDANPGDGGSVTAYLYTDTGGSGPGTLLGTIGSVSDSSLSATARFVDFPVSSTINLDAGTRYWVEFSDSAGSGAFLGFDFSNAGTGVAGEYFIDQNGVERNTSSADAAQVTEDATCFCTGARILTSRGEVPVEKLRIGDKAVTASGKMRPIEWIGHRKANCRDHANPRMIWPVRIVADAFGPGKPRRDLFLSPGHAVCVDLLGEVLIGASALVNGGSVAQIETDEVTYWHVELDRHDILIANGLPAESYMDCGNRGWFTGGQGEVDPDRSIGSPASYCRPFFNSGDIVEVCRSQLSRRAEAIGWHKSYDMDMHLRVDGRRVDAEIDGDQARFRIGKGATDVWLMSEVFIPAWRAGSDDRRLGVCLAALHVGDGLGVAREIALDDVLLGEGLHALETAEARRWRWTNGRCRLPAQLWADCTGDVALSLRYCANSGGYRWIAPTLAAEAEPPQATNVVRLRVA